MFTNRPFLFVNCLFYSSLLYKRKGSMTFSLELTFSYDAVVYSTAIDVALVELPPRYFFVCVLDDFVVTEGAVDYIKLLFEAAAFDRKSICFYFFQAVHMKSQSALKDSSAPYCHQYRCFSTLLTMGKLFPGPTWNFLA